MASLQFSSHNIPPNLVGTLPHPETPWVFSPSLQERFQGAENKGGLSFKRCIVLPSDPEWDIVWRLFHAKKPTGFGIKRIHCVYKEEDAQFFSLYHSANLQRAEEEKFRPTWDKDAHSALRERVAKRWNQLVADPKQSKNVYVLPLWHGTSEAKIDSICHLGFHIPGKHEAMKGIMRGDIVDPGYFGSGIYFTTSPKYAVDVYSKGGAVLLVWVSMRKPYPVIHEDKQHQTLLGKGAYGFHDAHYIPVHSARPEDPYHPVYDPVKPDQLPMCDEVVVFNQAQALPAFWVELQPDLPFAPTTVPQSVGDLLNVVVNALQHKTLERDGELRDALKKRAGALLVFNEKTALSEENMALFNQLVDLFRVAGRINEEAKQQLIGLSSIPPIEEGPFRVVEKNIKEECFDLAWKNLLIKLPHFLETAKEGDTESLYRILTTLIPHLSDAAREDLLNKVIHPLRVLGLNLRKRLTLELRIADWLLLECKYGLEADQWLEKIYKPAFEAYGRALELAKKLSAKRLPDICKKASGLLSNVFFEMLPLLKEAVKKQDQAYLEGILRDLILIRETFCNEVEEQRLLIPYFEALVPFFADHPLRDQSLVESLGAGQLVDKNNRAKPYVELCDSALDNWKGAFDSVELLTAFPKLYEKLAPKNGWVEGCQLLLAILGISLGPSSVSPGSIFKDFALKRPRISFVEFALQTAVESKTTQDVEQYFTMAKEAAAYLLEKGVSEDEHERLYRTLSSKTILEPLRESYLSSLPEGPLLNKLAAIPNRNGYRQKVRIEQEALVKEIEAITHTETTSVEILAPFFTERRFLKQEMINLKLDEQREIKTEEKYKGNLEEGDLGCAHKVCHMEEEGLFDLHLKQEPSQPMLEYAVYSLTGRIAGKGVPPSSLVRFEVTLSNGASKTYPVLISKTVSGDNLKTVLKGAFPELDRGHLTHMQLLGLLTRSGDGRASNYIVTGKEIHSIDNDVSFVEPMIYERPAPLFLQTLVIHFKSILYCLDRGPLDPKVLQEWKELSPELLFEGWIEDIAEKEKGITHLFEGTSFRPQLTLRQGTITTLYAQLNNLQKVLREDPPKNGLDLLKHLITLRGKEYGINDLGPRLHRVYSKAYAAGSSPSERLLAAIAKRTDQSVTHVDALKAGIGKVPTEEELKEKGPYSIEELQNEFRAFAFLSQGGVIGNLGGEKLSIRCDFSPIRINGKPDIERQRLMLTGLQEWKYPESVSIIGCEALTSEDLAPFLHDGLVELELIGCPNLRKLTGPLSGLPKLVKLTTTACDNIEEVRLQAPLLEEWSARQNPKLSRVALNINLELAIEADGSSQLNLKELVRSWFPLIFKRNFLQGELSKGFFLQLRRYLSGGILVHMLGELIDNAMEETLERLFGAPQYTWKKNFGAEEAKALATILPYIKIDTLDLGREKSISEIFLIPTSAEERKKEVLKMKEEENRHDRTNKYIGASGAKALADALPKTQITSLDLTGKHIGDAGVIALAAVLPRTEITDLNLSRNSIGEAGKGALDQILHQTKITRLNLQENNFYDERANLLENYQPIER